MSVSDQSERVDSLLHRLSHISTSVDHPVSQASMVDTKHLSLMTLTEPVALTLLDGQIISLPIWIDQVSKK
jgi:hypothetical protein